MLLWLAHCAGNFLWDAQRDCLWRCGAFPFRDFGLPRTGSSSVVYPNSLDSLCSSSNISSSSAWAMGPIWNGPRSPDPLAPQYIYIYIYIFFFFFWETTAYNIWFFLMQIIQKKKFCVFSLLIAQKIYLEWWHN